jgi:hypothetical protein
LYWYRYLVVSRRGVVAFATLGGIPDKSLISVIWSAIPKNPIEERSRRNGRNKIEKAASS